MSLTETLTFIGTSKNGIKVFYDPVSSHAATHIHDTPQLMGLVKEVIAAITLEKEKELVEYDLHRTIGKSDLLETTDSDQIVYAKRLNRDNYTRFVLNRQSVDTSKVTLILLKQDDSSYILFSAWIGFLVPPFPGSGTETPESITFWSNHALAWGTQDIQPNTQTTVQPW